MVWTDGDRQVRRQGGKTTIKKGARCPRARKQPHSARTRIPLPRGRPRERFTGMTAHLPFKISALVFVRDGEGRHLLIKRRKAPNLGCWSPIGGKLDMARGESPYECARREVHEEIGLSLAESELRLFGYISEKSYEGAGHWLMFLFDCLVPLQALPPAIEEGDFAVFARQDIDALPIPETDARLLWPYFDQYRGGFVGLRANCDPAGSLEITEELTLPPHPGGS